MKKNKGCSIQRKNKNMQDKRAKRRRSVKSGGTPGASSLGHSRKVASNLMPFGR